MEKVIPAFLRGYIVFSVFLLALCFSSQAFSQKTFNASVNNNWSVAANWSPAGVPGSGDPVIIPTTSVTVIVDANANCASLTLQVAGVNKTFTINTGITLTTGAVTVGSPTTNGRNNILNVNAGTLICSSITMADPPNTNRNSIINVTTGLLDVNGNITIAGSNTENQINITSSGKWQLSGTLTAASNASITLSANSTVELDGTGTQPLPFQTINFNDIYGNVTISNSTTAIAANQNFSVAGVFTINTGATVNMGTASLTSVGTTAGTGLLTTTNTGTTPIPADEDWSFNVQYSGGNQNVVRGTYGSNLIISGTGVKTLKGNTTVVGDFNLLSSRFNLNNVTSYTLNVDGNLNLTAGNFDFNPSTGVSVLNLKGNFTNAGATFQTSALTSTINGALNFIGTTTQTFTNANYTDIKWVNYFVKSPAVVVLNSNLPMDQETDPIFQVKLTVESGGTLNMQDKSTQAYDSDGSTGTIFTDIQAGGTLITSNTAGINGSIPATNTTSTYSTAANYEFRGTAASVTGSFTPTTVNNLTINTTNTVSSSQAVTVNGVLALTNGTFNMGTFALTAGASFSNSGTGTLRTQNTTSLPIPSGKTWSGSVQYDANVAPTGQTIVVANYKGLTLSNNSPKNFAAGTTNVSGDWTSSGGKVDLVTNVVALDFNGSAAQTLTENGSDAANGVFFKTVSFSGGGKKTMGGTGKFSVASDGVLTMAGTTELASGDILYLKSIINQTASVAPIPTGASITGNVFAERFMRGNNDNARRGYRLMSSPVQSSATNYNVFNLKQNMYITGNPAVADLASSLPGDFSKFDYSPNNNPTIYHYRESSAGLITQYDYYGIGLPLNGNEFNIGEGMYLFYRGLRTPASTIGAINRFSTTTKPEDNVLVFKGKINQGPYPVALSFTNSGTVLYDGYNLIGNPYPSTIDLMSANITFSSLVSNNINVLDPTTKSFVTFNKSSGVGTLPSATRYIASGQGFFVQAASTGQSVTFNETAKVMNQLLSPGAPLLLMSTSPVAASQPQYINLLFSSQTDSTAADGIVIGFDATGKENFDLVEDGSDLGGNGTTFLSSFSKDNYKLAYNALPSITKNTKVKLSVISALSGDFYLKTANSSSLDSRFEAKLVDNFKTDTIKLASNPKYNFSIDRSNAKTYEDGRFEIIFSEKTSNVNTILNFTGKAASKSINLAWQTTSTVKNVVFTLEKSLNGTTFTSLTNINSDNRTVYSHDDLSPAIGNNYYRLKQTDANNLVSYSNVINIKFDTFAIGGNKGYKIYPVPARNVLNVQLNDDYDGAIAVKIVDFFGRVIKKTSYDEGNFSIDVSKLKIGTYILELSNKNKLIGRSTFLKL
ncbi:MAG: T9SS type A sorting domain-containing protein [Flavobacteriales bacterium]|nr:MAG: T9SS type A sorting domain-containing protein [Flavobacteriales bacterium]